MNGQNRATVLFGAALGAALMAGGCKPAEEAACGLFHCSFEGDEGIRITLTKAVERFGNNLPATVKVCSSDRCAEANLKREGNKIACSSKDVRIDCSVQDSGDVLIKYAVEMPDPDVSLRVSVTDQAGKSLYDHNTTAKVKVTKPSNLDCPTVCREADIKLTPPVVTPTPKP
jgi:hypothetical protein